MNKQFFIKEETIFKNGFFYFFCIWLIMTLSFRLKEILNPLYLYKDISIHYFLYLVNKYDSFLNDPYINYIKQFVTNKSEGLPFMFLTNWYYWISCLFAKFISPLSVLKVWLYVQNFLSCLIIFQIFNKKSRTILGLFAVIFFQIILLTTDTYHGGAPRGCMGFIILLFTYSVIYKKFYICILSIFIGSLFYPQILPFLFIAAFFEFSFNKYKFNMKRVFFFIGFAILIISYYFIIPFYFSNVFKNSQARTAYSAYKDTGAFYSGKIFHIIYDIFINFVLNNNDHPGKEFIVIFIIFSFLIILFYKKSNWKIEGFFIKPMIRLLFYSFFSFFLISSFTIFSKQPIFFLHIAGKQTKVFIPFFLSFLCSLIVFYQVKHKIRALIIIFIGLNIYYVVFPHTYNLNLKPYYNIYTEIKKIEDSDIILGQWEDVEFIPLLTGKTVYSMDIWSDQIIGESFHNMYIKRNKLLKKMRYFTYFTDELINTLKENNITHILINTNNLIQQVGTDLINFNEFLTKYNLQLKLIINDNNLYLLKLS